MSFQCFVLCCRKITAVDPRNLRAATNGFMDSLVLALEVKKEFSLQQDE